MTSDVSRGVPESGWLIVLRRVALIAVLAGAAGSVGFMLRAGRRQNSRVLMLLFLIWVLSPFTAAVWANVISKRWRVVARVAVYATMLAITLGSLAIYGDVAFGRLRVKTGFIFLVVPFASWLLLAVVVALAAAISGGLSRRGKPA